MAFNTAPGVETRARERTRLRDIANVAKQPGTHDTFPGLPFDVVVTHILRSENLADPIDLARLGAVSRGMRDAVAATGRTMAEHDGYQCSRLEYLSTLKHMRSRGRLAHVKYLCLAAASGQLEELKLLREDGCPWNEMTCAYAAWGGHIEVMQWERVNGCPWDERTCSAVALGGHLEVLKWASAKAFCPWDRDTCAYAAQNGHLEVLQWARANGCP